jgi:DNA-binding CsgD family transcriptional regulator
MHVDGDGRAALAGGPAERLPLGDAVADMYADLRVTPLLQRLLTHTRGLLGTAAGSISLVDAAHGRYDKIAENGITCQLGRSFPLDEGATGQAFAGRRPVVIDDYSALRGHLPSSHPASRGAAAAVPLWWRGDVIGVNVAFAGHRRRFTASEVDAFELLTQSVAAAVVQAGSTDPSLARLIRERGDPTPAPPPAGPSALTHREDQVLRLMADGLSDRQVAARLVISPKTVEKHVGAVLRKTGAASRTAAVVRALERGWLSRREVEPRPVDGESPPFPAGRGPH